MGKEIPHPQVGLYGVVHLHPTVPIAKKAREEAWMSALLKSRNVQLCGGAALGLGTRVSYLHTVPLNSSVARHILEGLL